MKRVHLMILGGGLLLYGLVHAGLVAGDSPLRFHGPDVIAGAVLLSLFELAPVRPRLLTELLSTYGGKTALVLGASFSWEVVMPLLTSRSTPDWLDVLAYLAGGTMQHIIVRVARPVPAASV